jgi:ABC-type lipoprotein export system ATPase subunit
MSGLANTRPKRGCAVLVVPHHPRLFGCADRIVHIETARSRAKRRPMRKQSDLGILAAELFF